jgi:hypothetical protein
MSIINGLRGKNAKKFFLQPSPCVEKLSGTESPATRQCGSAEFSIGQAYFSFLFSTMNRRPEQRLLGFEGRTLPWAGRADAGARPTTTFRGRIPKPIATLQAPRNGQQCKMAKRSQLTHAACVNVERRPTLRRRPFERRWRRRPAFPVSRWPWTGPHRRRRRSRISVRLTADPHGRGSGQARA